MGINTVRFYLNYGLFEEDGEPYRYKETGDNLEWAKKNGFGLYVKSGTGQFNNAAICDSLPEFLHAVGCIGNAVAERQEKR